MTSHNNKISPIISSNDQGKSPVVIPSPVATKRRASEGIEDATSKKARLERISKRILGGPTQNSDKQNPTESWFSGVNREELMVHANESLKLISVKDSECSSSEDLIVVRNCSSADIANVSQPSNPSNAEDISDEYVIFASDVIDYIDHDHYLVAPAKSSPNSKDQQGREKSCKPIIKKEDTSEHNGAEEIRTGSPGMNEIEFVLLPSHKEIVDKTPKKVDSIVKNFGTITTHMATKASASNPSCKVFHQSITGEVHPNGSNNSCALEAVKNEQYVVSGTKKSVSEVKPTTAKVSIGNTTISVPLLKPLNTPQIIQQNTILNDVSKVQQRTSKSSSLHQFSLSKILNVKRACPNINQTTIVSLSQLQIKPVANAKILQAKVLGKKMQLPLPNALTSTIATCPDSLTSAVAVATPKSKLAVENCVPLASSEKNVQDISNELTDNECLLNYPKLATKDIPNSGVTKRDSFESNSLQKKGNENYTAIKKRFSSDNGPPTLMPLCKFSDQTKPLQGLPNAISQRKSIFASSAKQSKHCFPCPSILASTSAPSSECKTISDTTQAKETTTSKSQSLLQSVIGRAGSPLIPTHNISLLVTKGKNNQYVNKAMCEIMNTTQISAKTNESLEISQNNLFNIIPECSTAAKIAEISSSKMASISVAVESAEQGVEILDSKNVAGNVIQKPINTHTSSVYTTANVKRAKPDDEFENDLTSNNAKKTNYESKTENFNNVSASENLQRNAKHILLENEDTLEALKAYASPTQFKLTMTASTRLDETNNVLLKQLLQNSSSSVNARTSKSPSPPDCNQVMSSRKVINVRAPCLGLVSSLEAQLARPVIPPVPTTHQESKIDPLLSKKKIQNCNDADKEIKQQNDLKAKSVSQIISKETSFVSCPKIGKKHKEDIPKSGIQDSIKLPESTITPHESTKHFADGQVLKGIKASNKVEKNVKTSEHTKNIMLIVNSATVLTKIAKTEGLIKKNECYKLEKQNEEEEEEEALIAKQETNRKNKREKGSTLPFKGDEPKDCQHSNNNGFNSNSSTQKADIGAAAEILQPSSGSSQSIVKSSSLKDFATDTEIRKKRKRDNQKHRRQYLNNSKEIPNAPTAIASTSTCSPKKRARKIVKVEEDYDSFVENLMSHIRQMQPLHVKEPLLNCNLNASSLYGKTFAVLRENSGRPGEYLAGDFGRGKHFNIRTWYKGNSSSYVSSEEANTSAIQNDFYDQEFIPTTCNNKSEKMLLFLGMLKERAIDTQDIVKYRKKAWNEAKLGDKKLENNDWITFSKYPGLISKNVETERFGRMSPVLPYVDPSLQAFIKLPWKSWRKYENISNPTKGSHSLSTHGDNKGSHVETVILSLSLSAVANVVGVLKELASLLNITSPPSYNLIDSKSSDKRLPCNVPVRRNLLSRAEKSSLGEILNGRRKICVNCGNPLTRGEFRLIRKASNNPKWLYDELPFFENMVYLCSRMCHIHYKMQEEKLTKHVKTKSKQGIGETLLCPEKTDSLMLSENTSKISDWKYFSKKCFTPSLPLKIADDDDLLDILLKLEMTVSSRNEKQERIEDMRQCFLCNQRGDSDPNGPSRLLNVDIGKYVHLNCALWSSGVYETLSGGLVNLHVALQVSLNQTCISCQKFGATVKCVKGRCLAIYHLPCALKEGCVFYKNKTVQCQQHASKSDKENELNSIAAFRRIFVERDENRQVAAVMHQSECNSLLRIGAMIFLNVGQLLPHQLDAFHNANFIYPIGYKIVRFYWSMKHLNKRCCYICSIIDVAGKPEFRIEVKEPHDDDIVLQDSSPKEVWLRVLEPIACMRKDKKLVQLFTKYISGEDLFGLTEPAIVRIIESLPGVENLMDYRCKYGRNPLLELPPAINPTGSARTEPKQRQLLGWRKPHTQRTGSLYNLRVSNPVSSVVAGEVTCPYSKQFVHSKSSQYRKMKQEWRNNVYLARSKIQGLGLYAARDMEKHTMIIEYIGEVIRKEVSEIREKQYESRNRGIYMFRLDEERIVDATLSGGLARYINHSCNPNCVTETVEVDRELRIIIFAKRRISRSEELCYDYKFDIEDDANKIQCMCGAGNCRKWMN